MDISVSLDQLKTFKTAMSAQLTVIYSVDPNDSTKVLRVGFFDTKLGDIGISWEGAAPDVSVFLSDFPGAILVSAIG